MIKDVNDVKYYEAVLKLQDVYKVAKNRCGLVINVDELVVDLFNLNKAQCDMQQIKQAIETHAKVNKEQFIEASAKLELAKQAFCKNANSINFVNAFESFQNVKEFDYEESKSVMDTLSVKHDEKVMGSALNYMGYVETEDMLKDYDLTKQNIKQNQNLKK